ncbi:hypothetical protein UFOVP1247_112 [uncultured Caudovirales phage]|uniref:Uncharacterized protein n=1 Tax=uncultured Caudovirales phage TaxID=2100421 RepID=A0A6J5Q1P2_9CAUD|nr:hypothetical protein UFOVP970_152 [uncultured Caudovirales phage]CAB4193623.1 hypothetical protein UFOVP1247_112 [uncultured Caudovirales phage]
MSKEIFFNLKNIGHKDIAARSEEDLGLDWDIHSDTKTLGDILYSDAGLVKIEDLIAALVELNSKGANYVACDWHCDHQELEVYGVEFRLSTPEEATVYIAKRDQYKKESDEVKIKRLEEQLKTLKGE